MSEAQYSGPEQRKDPQGGRRTSDTCVCHLKHTAILDEHSKELSEVKSDVKVLEVEMLGRLRDRVSKADMHEVQSDVKLVEADMKSKVSLRLFITCVLIFVAMSGFIYNQLHGIDKQVTQILTRQEAIRSTVADSDAALQRAMMDLQRQIRDLDDNPKRQRGEGQ